MKNRLVTFLPVTVAVGASVALTFSGCGNSWLDSKDRAKTPAALMFEAQKAYDEENYAKAAELFSDAVAKDPTNVSARIGWSFALNGQAGLSLTGIMQQIIAQKAGQTNLADSTTSATSFVKIVGLSSDETTALNNYAASSSKPLYGMPATTLRAKSSKLAKLNESWRAICPVLPVSVINGITDPTAKTIFAATNCMGTSATTNSAALFAAAVGLFGQAGSLYQLLYLQPNGELATTEPYIVADIKSSFDNLQAASTSSSGPAEKITVMNSALEKINSGVNSELIPWTIASFELLANLVAAIPGMPDSMKTEIAKSTTTLRDSQTKITEYKTAGVSATQSLSKSLSTASTQIQTVLAAGNTTITAEQKTAICNNFDVLVAASGVTTGVTKPTDCPTSLVGANLVPSGTAATVQQPATASAVAAVPAIEQKTEPISQEKLDSMYLSLIEFFQLAQFSQR